MRLVKTCRAMLAGLGVWAAAAGPASAQTLDKVSFGTNWVAEGEHGGFYQALADGTYRKYGLDVTIVPGGPSTNNQILLPVGKIDFFLSANSLQGFDAVTQNVPVVEVAALFQKDPQVFIAHPDQGIEKFEDLKNLTLFVSAEGVATYYQWLKADYGFKDSQVRPYTSNAQPFIVNPKSAMQGYVTSEPFAIAKAAKFTPKGVPARRPGLFRLFDLDRDAPRSGRQEARPGAALRRCLDRRLVQLHLPRQFRRQCADQETEPGNDRRSVGLLRRQDEAIRHRRFRRRHDARRRRHDRRAHEGFFRQDGALRRHQGQSRLPQILHAAVRRQEGRARSAAESIDDDLPRSFRHRSHRRPARRRQDVSERHGGAGRPRSRRPRRRVPVAARSVGLRQIDSVADHRRADRADAGCRRMDSRGQDRKRESIGLRVSGADTDAVGQRVQQRAAAAQAQGRRIGASVKTRRGGARSRRLAKIRRRLSARIVRRHAHAGLDRARAGHRA